jgi:hypothetical protein
VAGASPTTTKVAKTLKRTAAPKALGGALHLAAAADKAEASAEAAKEQVRAAKAVFKKARKASKLAKQAAKEARRRADAAAMNGKQAPTGGKRPAIKAGAKIKTKAKMPRKRKAAVKTLPTAAEVARSVIRRLGAKRPAAAPESNHAPVTAPLTESPAADASVAG